jgi:hypothetical protein
VYFNAEGTECAEKTCNIGGWNETLSVLDEASFAGLCWLEISKKSDILMIRL